MASTVYTFCRYCLAHCGVEVTVADNSVVKIAPDRANPHSWQDFCAKGRTAARVVDHPRRILTPMRRVGDGYVEASWDEALDDIATRLNAILEAHGCDAVASYTGNPSGGSTSNSVFLSALMEAIGSQNRYFVGSVDQNALHVVAEAMYGSMFMAPVSDVDHCDYFLIIGANPAVSAWNWLESVPGGWKRALDRQRNGATIVVVDPLRTESAAKADVHLAVRPGEDWALLLAMIKVVFDEHLEHAGDCRDLAHGVDELRCLAAEADIDALAQRCGIAKADIVRTAVDFARARTAMAITRTGVSQTTNGTVGEWLGHVLNVITGRMDRPGGRRLERGYFNAPGFIGKTQKPVDHRSRLQQRPQVAGHHGLDELPDEITTPGPGRIRALIMNAGNPVISGPDGAKLDAALGELDLLVVADLVQRESHRHAHWLLPAAHWLEREDVLVLLNNGHDAPFAQFGSRAINPPPGVREDWRIYTDIALALKRPLFGLRGVNGFIQGTRWLARTLKRPGLAFHAQWVERLMVASGRRVKWRDLVTNPHGILFAEKEYGHLREALLTQDKRIHVAPPEFVERARELLDDESPHAPHDHPFQLANRRSRHAMNSWLNEVPGLHPGGKGNDVTIHPDDAADLSIADGDLVEVYSPTGRITLPARVSDEPRRGVLVIDHGWGSRVFDPAGGAQPESYGVNRNLLVPAEPIDPLSQQSPLNGCFVGIRSALR